MTLCTTKLYSTANPLKSGAHQTVDKTTVLFIIVIRVVGLGVRVKYHRKYLIHCRYVQCTCNLIQPNKQPAMFSDKSH